MRVFSDITAIRHRIDKTGSHGNHAFRSRTELNIWREKERIYRIGFGVQALKPDEIPEKIIRKIHKCTDVTAAKIRLNAGKTGVSLQGRFWFGIIRFAHRHMDAMPEIDRDYWEERGWHGKKRPWVV